MPVINQPTIAFAQPVTLVLGGIHVLDNLVLVECFALFRVLRRMNFWQKRRLKGISGNNAGFSWKVLVCEPCDLICCSAPMKPLEEKKAPSTALAKPKAKKKAAAKPKPKAKK